MGLLRLRRGLRTAEMGGGGETELQRLLSSMRGAGSEAGIWRADAGGAYIVNLAYRLTGGLYMVMEVYALSFAVDAEPPNIYDISVSRLWESRDQDQGTLNGSWATFSNSAYYSGDYARTTTAGDYFEFTTQANADAVGFFGGNGTNVGMILVEITDSQSNPVTPNGANVKTAQQWVTDGVLDSSALIANGGTLNPTDYLLDESLITAIGDLEVLAENLTAETYTVRLTCTGYARIGQGNHTLIASGLGWSGAAIGSLSDEFYMEVIQQLSSNHVWEISYNHKPTGASSQAWIGHQGQQVLVDTSPVVVVDGVTQASLNDGEKYVGKDVKYTEHEYGRHPDLGATNTADIYMSYRMNATTGMWISHTLEWLTDGVVSGEPFMWALDRPPIDTCSYIGSGQDFTLTGTGSENIAIQNNGNPNHAFAWDADGPCAMIMYVPDVATSLNNYQDVGGVDKVHVWDATSPDRSKCYFVRVDAYNYSTNESWSAECNYRFGYWSSGANSHLTQA